MEELRTNINRVLRGSHPRSNLSKAEAIRELKGDEGRLVLTADKGVAMVLMDRQDYINKPNNLLVQPAHRPIPRDPTNKIKAELITLLRKVTNQTGLYNNKYKAIYPMDCSDPNSMGSPRSISQTPPQAYSVQLRICYLWSGQGTYQNSQTSVS